MKTPNHPLLSIVSKASSFFISVIQGRKKSYNYIIDKPADFAATFGATEFKSQFSISTFFPVQQYFTLEGIKPTMPRHTAILQVNIPSAIQLNRPINVNTTPHAAIYYSDSQHLIDYQANSLGGQGIIMITSWDAVCRRISGTFSGTLINKHVDAAGTIDAEVIANGQFDTSYSVLL